MDWLQVVPFLCILAGIALLPLCVPHLWEHPAAPAVLVTVCSLPVLIYQLGFGQGHELLAGIEEYVAFIVLIGTLYVVSGGIHVSGNPKGTPVVNMMFLLVGSIAASLIGTTGASMLMIRPLLHANAERKHKRHIVIFFILLVSNAGGMLTPLGDPPLYLGYLHGVPFTFPMRLWPAWTAAVGILLVIFWLLDGRAYQRESPKDLALDAAREQRIRIDGGVNFLIAGGVIVVSAAGVPHPFREPLYLALSLLSLFMTSAKVRRANRFNYGPLMEVAILFVGIFITMGPAIQFLRLLAPSLPVDSPVGLFLMSGSLSSILDNAPTYLVFANLAAAREGLGGDLGALAAQAPHLLAAVSVGSVLMGANTYIGNGPNLLVKAVAEGAGPWRVPMPSFLAYAAIAIGTLSPVYLVVAYLMFL